MAGRFLSHAMAKNNQDDDLLQMQKSALSGASIGSEDEKQDIGYQQDDDLFKEPEMSKGPGEESVIRKGVVIKGSVSSVTSMFICGTVKGDVTCDNDVTVDGTVEGNVKAANVRLLSGSINGDVESQNEVSIIKEATITGNVNAGLLDCDGKIEGNLTVAGLAEIKGNGTINGDLICESIIINKGASINGNFQTKANNQANEPIVLPKEKKTANDKSDIKLDTIKLEKFS